jgi:hypothetical protein
MRNIPDILQSSFKTLVSSAFISKSVHSYSNNNPSLFDCQLNDEQIKHCDLFLKENLTNAQFRVFEVLMHLTLKHQGNVFPSYDVIASMAKCVRATAQSAVKRLRELNIIETEYRGYHQTLIYRMHQFYITNRQSIGSLVRNTVDMSLLFLRSTKRLLKNWYLLNIKVAYCKSEYFFKEKNVVLKFTENQMEEIGKHSLQLYERAYAIFKRKLDSGQAIANAEGYIIGIMKQEAAKRQSFANPADFRSKDPKTGMQKPYVRPKDGPNAIYKHKQERTTETDFEIATKLEIALHTNPNSFSLLVADMHKKKLPEEDQLRIQSEVHQNCKCRSGTYIGST